MARFLFFMSHEITLHKFTIYLFKRKKILDTECIVFFKFLICFGKRFRKIYEIYRRYTTILTSYFRLPKIDEFTKTEF